MNDEEMTEAEYQAEIEKLAMEGAERSMAAQSDAVIGLIGAGIFAISGVNSTGGLIAGAIGIAAIAFFIRGLKKRTSIWTFLLGVPAAAVVFWKISSLLG